LHAREQDIISLSEKLRIAQAQKTQLLEDWKAAGAQNINLSLALQAKVGDLLAAQAEMETVKNKFLSLRNASAKQESVLRERLNAAATDVQSLTRQHKVQEAAHHDLLELLSSRDKELNSTRANLAAVQSRVADLVTQLGVLQQVHLESEARERSFREVMQHNLTSALGNKDHELNEVQKEMSTIEESLHSVETALQESERARQFLVAQQRTINATLDTRNLELDNVHTELADARHRLNEVSVKDRQLDESFQAKVMEAERLREALAAASNTAVKSAEQEHRTNATLEATVSEVDRLRVALAAATDKAAGEERMTNAALQAKASEVERLRASLAAANHRAAGEEREERWTNATLEATASEVDRLRVALAAANDKAAGEERMTNATLEAKAAEVDRLRAALAAANYKAAGEAREERWTNATLEAKASEVDRLRAALAAANDKAVGEERWGAKALEVDRLHAALAAADDKALAAAEEITALKREGSELKFHDANLQHKFDAAMVKDAKLNKHLTEDNSDTLQRATLARDITQFIHRVKLDMRHTHEGGMEADAQEVEHELDAAQAALNDSMEQHAPLPSAVESTLAAVTSALAVRDVQLRADRSLLEDALANASALQAEVRGLTKALKVEDHALKAAHAMLNTARGDVNDLVAAHHAGHAEPAKKTEVKKLQTEMKKMHNIIQHDEKLIHQYQRRERRLRAQLRVAE